jgi:outer membrane protein assembly factor BamB
VPATLARAENWPQFRGPSGQGHTECRNLPLTWGGPKDKQENVAWKSPLVGQGHASPIVWGDRVFVCTAHWPPEVKQREKVIPEHHVLCYSTADGKRLWDTLVPPGPWVRSDFRSGPGGGYACPTPVTDGHHVYCLFGSSVIAALDFQGKIVWRKDIVPHTFDVTLGTSPILYGDTLLYVCPMANLPDSKILAYNPATGEVKWSKKIEIGFGHSTPLVIKAGGKTQMLVLAGGMSSADKGMQSFDPSNGDLLWWCRAGGETTSPAYGAGIVYADSGRGSPGVAVDPTGKGNVTKTHVKWTIPQVPEALSSPIIIGKHVYRLQGPGVLKCWDAADGRQVYVQRLERLGSNWASPIADPLGRIYFATAGKSYVIQAGPEFKVLATNDLDDGNHPSPAVSGDSMFLVGLKHVWCVRKPKT